MDAKPWITIMLNSECNNYCNHCYINYSGHWEINEARDTIIKLRNDYNIQLNSAELLVNNEYLSLFPLINQKHLLTNGKAIYENHKFVDDIKKPELRIFGYHIIMAFKILFQHSTAIASNLSLCICFHKALILLLCVC